MKFKKIAILACLCSSLLCNAQSDKVRKTSKADRDNGTIFLNLGGGFNNPFGFAGLGVDVAVHPHGMVGAGIGLSTWGTKVNLKGVFFFKENYHGGALAVSLNNNTGFNSNNFEYDRGNTGSIVKLDIKTSNAISANLMYTNYRHIGKKSKFYIQAGFVAPLVRPTIDITYSNNGTKFIESDRLYEKSLRIFSPGGLVGNVGFLIALQ
jgi:hypothetical protein